MVVHACIPNTEEANASMDYIIDSISEILFQKEQGEEEKRLAYYTCEWYKHKQDGHWSQYLGGRGRTIKNSRPT